MKYNIRSPVNSAIRVYEITSTSFLPVSHIFVVRLSGGWYGKLNYTVLLQKFKPAILKDNRTYTYIILIQFWKETAYGEFNRLTFFTHYKFIM